MDMEFMDLFSPIKLYLAPVMAECAAKEKRGGVLYAVAGCGEKCGLVQRSGWEFLPSPESDTTRTQNYNHE